MSGSTLIKRLSTLEGTTAITKRQTTSNDQAGFPVPTFTTLLTGLTVNVQYKDSSEAVKYGRMTGERFAIIYVEGESLNIKASDIMVVTFKNGSTVTFNILGPPRQRGSGNLLHTIVEAVELKGGLP